MPRKQKNDIIFREEIVQKPMETVMHDSMIPYSEYVILERAIPRVEDGLKPVQRRILYTMNELGNTHDKPHRKCARIVGDCLGKFHPHGDTSVYDALARMAQSFVMGEMLVDGHGNFGSIDGDSPAAMRYTEARMTLQAEELLRDIDKDTVGFHLNFDDSMQEPDVLPARFPNLLVNGASGIAVGLATNIPTHNLGECIDGAVALMENPDLTGEEMLRYIPAPDFPTGGIVLNDDELKQALLTGRGKIRVRAKVDVEDGSAGRKIIAITEIPYQVNKASMLEKILHLSEEKKSLFSGIYDIRDESDRTGMRAVVELRRDADVEKTLAALYKYSDLQISYGVNMVAIAGGKPLQMGIRTMLGYFIAHQKDVVTRRTRYELRHAEARAHILEGLIIAVDNLDEVIRIIRGSKNPKEAREKLMEAFRLSEMQAQAILDMRLQRLTNLEILSLRKEFEELQKTIKRLRGILQSEKKLIEVIKGELLEIKQKFPTARRTVIADSFSDDAPIVEQPEAEETSVIVTYEGFFKAIAPRLLEKAGESQEGPRFRVNTMTDIKIFLFTTAGMCHQLPVSHVPECRLRDRGMPMAGLVPGLEKGEELVFATEYEESDREILFVTKQGQVKRAPLSDFCVRTRKCQALGLKDGDSLAAAFIAEKESDVIVVTREGMAIDFAAQDVPVQGRSASGVRAISLAATDSVLTAFARPAKAAVLMASERGYMKKCPVTEFEKQARGGKGAKVFSLLKNGANGSEIAFAAPVSGKEEFICVMHSGTRQTVTADMVRAENKAGRGQPLVIAVLDDKIIEMRKNSWE